jgi:hypothetical protein
MYHIFLTECLPLPLFLRRNFDSGSGLGSSTVSAQPLTSSNPFAFATLAQPTAMSSAPTSQNAGGQEPPSRPNPFANIAFALESTAAITAAPFKHTSSFTSSSTSAAPKPASSSFSFAHNVAASQLAATATASNTLLSTPRQSSSMAKSEKIQELNTIFLQTIVDHWEGRLRTCDYSQFMKEYLQHEENIEFEMENKAPAVDHTPTANLPKISKRDTQPASSLWSFGGVAPPLASKPFSFHVTGAPAPAAASLSAGTFSFTSKPAPFLSGAPPSATSTFTSAQTATSGYGNDDSEDPTSNPDDGKVDKVEQEENTEEVILYEVRAKHMKFEDKTWKKFGAGILRLYRHKTTSKHRMVIRNEIGKVQFNVGISKGMTFDKIIKDGKQGKATFAKFMAVEDASKGPEAFMLQVKPDCLDKLHETLMKMVA